MIGWICAGYGLLAGVVFFVYLCLFRHIRDNIEGRGSRFLHYFLLSVTFYLLARVTGVNVMLGLLPMLVVLHFVGKEGLGQVLAWSAAFGLFSFGWLFVEIAPRVTHPEDGAPASNVARDSASPSSSSPAPKFDLDKYFVSDAVDPTMEFDEPFKAEIDGRTLLLPVPKGYTCARSEEDKSIFYAFEFRDHDSQELRMEMLIPVTTSFPGKEPYQRLGDAKRDLIAAVIDNPNIYIEGTTSSLKKPNSPAKLESYDTPTIEQNRKNDIVSFFSFTWSMNGRTRVSGIMGNYSIIDEAFVEIVLALHNKTSDEDKRFGFTWLQKFTTINGLGESQKGVMK